MAVRIEHKHPNLVNDLDVTSVLTTPQRCIMQAPLTQVISNAKGAARCGMLATMVDVACSDPALAACRPDWTATLDLSVYATDNWLTEGPVVVDAYLLRAGKKIIFTAANLYDGHGVYDLAELQHRIDTSTDGKKSPTLVAKSLLSFARLPGAAAASADAYNPGAWVGQVRRRSPSNEDSRPIAEKIGINIVDASKGAIEVPFSPYIANSIGTINGGVQAIIMEYAAETMRPGMIASDMLVHFYSQLKVGPALTRGLVLRDRADHSVVEIKLYDAGTNSVLTEATITLQKL